MWVYQLFFSILIFSLYMSDLAGQTARPTSVTFIDGTLEYPWGNEGKKSNFFFNIFF